MLSYEIKDFLFSLYFIKYFFSFTTFEIFVKYFLLSLIVFVFFHARPIHKTALKLKNKFTRISRNKGIRQNCNNHKFIRASSFVKIVRGRFLRGHFLDSENAARFLSGSSTNEVRRGEDKSYLYYPRRWLTPASNKV